MFYLEANLIVNRTPESLKGHYGVIQTVPVHKGDFRRGIDTKVVTASTALGVALKFLNKRSPRRDIEHITSLEQAEKYASQPIRQKVRLRPDGLQAALEAVDGLSNPKDKNTKLTAGIATVWTEGRSPHRAVGWATYGLLTAECEYDADRQEWTYDTDQPMQVRRQKGLMTPFFNLGFEPQISELTPLQAAHIGTADFIADGHDPYLS